jgi:S-adenosylmethionine decarboxylase
MPVARITGTHLLADFYDIDADRLNDAHALAHILLDAARAARMTPLSTPVVLRFAGGGLTGFLPLAESHIAFHTYPERGYLAADVFTCGADRPPEAAVAVLRIALMPGRECVRVVPRGERVDETEIAP